MDCKKSVGINWSITIYLNPSLNPYKIGVTRIYNLHVLYKKHSKIAKIVKIS